MKKIIFCIAFFFMVLNAICQTYQTNVTFNAYSWAVMGGLYQGSDSIGWKFERRLNAAVDATTIVNYNTNVTVDTVPNTVIMWIYEKYKEMPGDWQTAMGTSIPTVIGAMTNPEIVTERTLINNRINSGILALRTRGKNKYIDQ